jgi:Ni/Co efflux regulator RcnB
MKRIAMRTNCALALALAGVLAAAPTLAEKPSGAGKGAKHEQGEKSVHHGEKSGHQGDKSGHQGERSGHQGEKSEHNKSGRHNGDEQSSHRAGPATGTSEHFGDRHRSATNQYYDDQFRSGRCPPGLAKKHNGCMPPGQAKKWSVGQPLPRDVTYYEVPSALVAQFGQPPSGYRYVRVGNDILLMALGTRMVTDAIRNLGRS